MIGTVDLHHPWRGHERAGRRHGAVQPRPARVRRPRRCARYRPARVRQPRHPPGAGQGAGGSHRRAGRHPAAGTARRVRQRAIVPVERGSDRPQLRSRRELPEPCRPGHRHPRRHRRLERHPRFHSAKDSQHRRSQVPGRPQPRSHHDLPPAGAFAGTGGQPAGCPSGAPRRGRHSARPGSHFLVAAGGCRIRGDVERGAAGPDDRRAGVAAVLDRAAAARAVHQAVAAAARRIDRAAARLGRQCRDRGGRSRPRRRRGVAVGIARDRSGRVRRLHGTRVRAVPGGPRR